MTKLLIADDEPGVRSLVRLTLESDAYEILEAANGQEALAHAREHVPEIVFLDVAMPRMSGLEVCRSLKEDPRTKGIIVVMLTARAQAADRQAGEQAGADGYLTKPFSPLELIQVVDDVLGLPVGDEWLGGSDDRG